MFDRPIIKIDKPGHIVVLDQSWHKLFEGRKSFRIKQLERKLNKLIQEQGKVNTEYDGYKKLKKKMMDEIVAGMGNENDKTATTNQKNSRYIEDINEKIDFYEEKKSVLPGQIEAVNKELLTESMIHCYKRLMSSKEESAKLNQSIASSKETLKEMVGKREDMEQEINQLYHFMHDIAGLEVIEAMDKHYFGGDK